MTVNALTHSVGEILTAIVTTVRSAKAVITTFCRMLSCEDRGQTRVTTANVFLMLTENQGQKQKQTWVQK